VRCKQNAEVISPAFLSVWCLSVHLLAPRAFIGRLRLYVDTEQPHHDHPEECPRQSLTFPMPNDTFQMPLYLPAQGASETEATIVEWCIGEGEAFTHGQVLGQIDSAKSVFDFEAPCDGKLVQLLHTDGDIVSYEEPVMLIETADAKMKNWLPAAAKKTEGDADVISMPTPTASPSNDMAVRAAHFLGFGGYVPERVVHNAEIIENYADVTAEYVASVTGIEQRRWARADEKPSEMALAAARQAIANAGIDTQDIDAIILATTTPDAAMPSTACILQDRLGIYGVPAFDLNAACAGWLYAVSLAQNMIQSGTAEHVLTVGVDLLSPYLDASDRATYFVFGDGAGAAVVSADTSGHAIGKTFVTADARGLSLAHRDFLDDFKTKTSGGDSQPGQHGGPRDPWVHMDGPGMFRFAIKAFDDAIQQALHRSGWRADEVRWVVPHQANSRILTAVAKRCGVPYERFLVNIDHVGNTSSASIPLAMLDSETRLSPGDRMVLCAVGAGATSAAITLQW